MLPKTVNHNTYVERDHLKIVLISTHRVQLRQAYSQVNNLKKLWVERKGIRPKQKCPKLESLK